MARDSEIQVIAPNLSRRVSGVTATISAVTPKQTAFINVVTTGNRFECNAPHLPFWKLLFLPKGRRVWHARRNNEMLVGILLKKIFRRDFKLVFTSSSPRKRGRFTQFLLRYMDAIVATASQNADVMPFCTSVVPHGVDTETFSPGKADLFGIGHNRVIGCFGRIRHMKGTHDFITAMCVVLRKNPDWTALIVGNVTQNHADYASGLQKKIDQEGMSDRIIFKEEVPLTQIPDAYRSISLYVAPSLLEGYGLTPFEAMASGIPTVATNVGAQSLAIENSGGGRLVEPGDAEALTKACADMLENRDTLTEAGHAARRHVETHFAIENEARALVEVYQGLLDAE